MPHFGSRDLAHIRRIVRHLTLPINPRLLCEDQTTKTDLDGAQDAIIDLMRDNGSAETSHSAILGYRKCNGQ